MHRPLWRPPLPERCRKAIIFKSAAHTAHHSAAGPVDKCALPGAALGCPSQRNTLSAPLI
eukprot:399643-Pyramimonas_sp.AAC.1